MTILYLPIEGSGVSMVSSYSNISCMSKPVLRRNWRSQGDKGCRQSLLYIWQIGISTTVSLRAYHSRSITHLEVRSMVFSRNVRMRTTLIALVRTFFSNVVLLTTTTAHPSTQTRAHLQPCSYVLSAAYPKISPQSHLGHSTVRPTSLNS